MIFFSLSFLVLKSLSWILASSFFPSSPSTVVTFVVAVVGAVVGAVVVAVVGAVVDVSVRRIKKTWHTP